MTWKIKLAYLIALGIILYPLVEQWHKPIEIPLKQALLPPELPKLPQTDSHLLKTLLAHNLWDKERKQLGAEEITEENNNKSEAKGADKANKIPLKWTLQAVNAQSSNPSIEIAINTQQEIYRLGDTLPENWVLLEILSDGIIIKQQEKIQRVYLFDKQ